jgi:23S rRNA pseudouridine1911/1915/1917 synthase
VNDELSRDTSYLTTEEDKDIRIDTFLAKRETCLTRSRIQTLIKEGNVKINGLPVKASYRLKTGDKIKLLIPPSAPYTLEPEPVELSFIYEDSFLIVINKPPGMVIHPAPGHKKSTLVHGLLHHCRDLSGIGGVLRPGIVHRLDKDTSGLLVVAKNDQAHNFLSGQFKEGKVNKRYVTLVHGVMEDNQGKIDLPISRNPKKRKEMAVTGPNGKRALTLWKKKDEIGGKFSLLSVTIKTGRTHQIRVHLSYIGHPVVGDSIYGYRTTWWKKHCPSAVNILPEIKRQMLHAEYLGFTHPDSKEYCEFEAPIPHDINNAIQSIKSLFI